MTRCPACGREWLDLPRHLQFVHQELMVMWLDAPDASAPEDEPIWVLLAYLAIGLTLLWLVASS